MIKLRLAAPVLGALLAALPTSAQALSDELKEKSVMIEVNFRRGGATEYGTGVVLCQEGDRAWILTANHVFAGKSAEPWKQIRLSQVQDASIRFYREYAPAIEADSTFLRKQMNFYTFKPDDLLLLSVPLGNKLPSVASLSPPPSEVDEQSIAAIGFWKDRGLTWEQVAGELAESRAGSSKFLYHTGAVHEGFSGGPLFNALGELIGINIQRVPGEQTPDGRPGSWYGKAHTLNDPEVLAVIDKWVPANCLESASQLSELAFFVYRKAMRAVSIRDWAAAEDLLSQALAQKPVEGGSVHLEAMRYTNYLPHYHLGLAYFKQKKYSDAIRAWDRSESQGAIRKDKRYGSLKRHRNRAYESLRRSEERATGHPQLAPREPTPEANAAENVAAGGVAAVDAAVEQLAREWEAPERAEADQAAAEEVLANPAAKKAAAEALEEKQPTHRVAVRPDECLNLRTAPSLEGNWIDCLGAGSLVRRLDQQDGWSRVRDADEREGWMVSDRIDPIKANEADEQEAGGGNENR